ncbi:MAG: cytochrome b [Betaproteobacteria bacterium]
MTSSRYTPTAIALHWLIAAMLVMSLSAGLYMTGLKFSPEKLRLYNWHKWAGVTIFMLVLFRAAWRLFHAPPAFPASIPAWHRRMATGTHYLLYALMIAIPLSGWLMSSAKGFQTVYFGQFAIPDLLDKNTDLGELLEQVHRLLNYTLIAIAVAHAAAGLKHHFIDRDDVLRRILPGRRS